MEAKEKSLKEIFGSGPQKLKVPFFQRRYVWKEENWDELLKSIEENEDVQAFLGSIIIKWGQKREPSEATIVDGQQRLTTISLLTKAIYDEFSDTTKSNVLSTIQNVLFYKRNTTDDVKKSEIKIEHSRVDKDDYEYIIRAGVFDGSSVDVNEIRNKCTGQIGKCYVYYREILHNKSQEEISKIFNIMYDDNNKMLIRIVLQEKDVNEQSIFDTINRAGARLDTADIIKNNIFKGFIESCNNDQEKINKVYNLYSEKWEDIFYSTNKENEWDKKRNFGNVSRSNLEFLLYCVACIKWSKDSDKKYKDFFSRLESVYTRFTYGYNFEEYKQLILEIHEYALLFSKHIIALSTEMGDDSKKEKKYFSFDEDVKRLLLTLEIFGVQMFYPYVLKILKDAGDNLSDSTLIKKSKMLESFVIRRRIIGSNVSDYATKCNMILNGGVELLFEKCNNKISIDDDEIKSALKNVKSETAKLILFWIELSRKNKNSDVKALTYTYTLEHIMPQKWQKNWAVSDDLVENRKEHINYLGNMTLLKNTLNSTVQNSDFSTKINGSGKTNEGYEGNTSLDITEEIVREYRNGKTIWNESRIEERTNRFAAEIINLWPICKK